MLDRGIDKELFRVPEPETNKHLFLKVAIMNRENNTHIFTKKEG